MSNYIYYFFAFAIGIFIGFIYFKSLFSQIQKFFNFKSSLMVIVGFLLRMIFVGITVFLLLRFTKPINIAFFLMGFLTVLIYMIIKMKTKSKKYEN